MKIQYAYTTDAGNRECNEDSVTTVENEKGYCFVVADGLGGHDRGEVASQTVCDAAAEYFAVADVQDVAGIFEHAQKLLLQRQESEHAVDEMKTTMNVVTLTRAGIQWGHIGDTRTYYFRKGKLVARTKDHSVPQMMVTMGEIKEKDIRHHEDRNRLLRVMGTEWDKPQYVMKTPVELDKHQVFLLCTDGFWELIEEKDMRKTLKRADTPQNWLERMNSIVKQNGQGTDMDNYTALAVWID